MAAKQSKLSELHEMLAEMFIQDIKMCTDEGIPMAASDKAVIVKFLKDNDITADADASDMEALRVSFAQELEASRQQHSPKYRQAGQGDATENIIVSLVN